jgi:hypothetical protein
VHRALSGPYHKTTSGSPLQLSVAPPLDVHSLTGSTSSPSPHPSSSRKCRWQRRTWGIEPSSTVERLWCARGAEGELELIHSHLRKCSRYFLRFLYLHDHNKKATEITKRLAGERGAKHCIGIHGEGRNRYPIYQSIQPRHSCSGNEVGGGKEPYRRKLVSLGTWLISLIDSCYCGIDD